MKGKQHRCSRHKKVMLAGLGTKQYNFEEVETFKYLEISIHRRSERIDIQERIQAGYNAFYANKQLLRNNTMTKNTKLKIYRTTHRNICSRNCKPNIKKKNSLKF